MDVVKKNKKLAVFPFKNFLYYLFLRCSMTWPTRLKIATILSLESTNSWIKSQSSRRGSGTRPSASSRPKMSPRRSVWDVWSLSDNVQTV